MPAPVAGAKPVAVERIKVRGASLEGNLEGNAVERDVLVFLPPGYAKEKSRRYPGRLRAARLLDRGRAVEQRDPRAADHRRRVRPGRARDDRRAAGLEDPAQRLDVFELADRRRFRAVRRPRPGRLRRRALPHAAGPGEPRTRRPLDGRLRRDAHRHEARGRLRQPLHHEPVLPVGAGRRVSRTAISRRRWPARRRRKTSPACRSAPARSSPRPRRGRPTRRRRRSISTCRRRTARREPTCSRGSPPTRRSPSSTSGSATCAATAPSPSTSATRTASASDSGKLHDVLDRYGIANAFEIYPGTHTSKVADRFQNHVLPFFHRTLCADKVCK